MLRYYIVNYGIVRKPYHIFRYQLPTTGHDHDAHTAKISEKKNGKNLINHFELITVVVDRFTLRCFVSATVDNTFSLNYVYVQRCNYA